MIRFVARIVLLGSSRFDSAVSNCERLNYLPRRSDGSLYLAAHACLPDAAGRGGIGEAHRGCDCRDGETRDGEYAGRQDDGGVRSGVAGRAREMVRGGEISFRLDFACGVRVCGGRAASAGLKLAGFCGLLDPPLTAD